MNAVSHGVDTTSAPSDYADFFARYYNYIAGVLRNRGVHGDYIEDAVGEILLTIMEEDLLSQFNPRLWFLYNNSCRPANFKSFISSIIYKKADGYRDKVLRRRHREPQIIDAPDRHDVLDDRLLIGGHEDNLLDLLDNEVLVADIRAYLGTVPRRSPMDMCDLVALWDAFITELTARGEVSNTVLREHFGVSPTAISTWRRRMKYHVGVYLGREVEAPR